MAPKKAFLLRLSPEMWQALESWAAEEFRSVNGQIEFIINEAIRRRSRNPAPAADSSPKPNRKEEQS